MEPTITPSPSEEERWQQLRAFLSDRPGGEKETSSWVQLCTLLESWPESTRRALAIEYALEHLEAWPDSARLAETKDIGSMQWQLARTGHIESALLKGTEAGATPPLSHFRVLQIDVSGTRGRWDEDGVFDLSSLADATTLHHLSFVHGYSIAWYCELEGYVYLPQLIELDAREIYIKDMNVLSGFPALTTLQSEAIALHSLAGIEALPQLQTLRLNSLWKVEDLTPLASLQRLQTLELELGNRGPHDLEALAHLPAIRSLRIEHPRRSCDISQVPELPTLESFHFVIHLPTPGEHPLVGELFRQLTSVDSRGAGAASFLETLPPSPATASMAQR